ncbi:Nramp family divalent metal transporter [Planctomicrobium sp. SH664]|uniref:Nramp family divalent metal transporter n=1 Tax=Planctomicrobium sp. SH664 TaxID=3448125 RepID=UPI003F5C434E
MTPDESADTLPPDAVAPYPGMKNMPQWELGTLSPAPIFTWRQLPLLIGPGLVLGAAAVGGGEWLTGPMVTARYGGSLLWLATLSILGQVIFNIEICRYTLYCGEPIFTGKFRLFPGPAFWPLLYLILDLGSFFPYLASNAAIPAVSMYLGRLVDPNVVDEERMLRIASYLIYGLVIMPLFVGGKVYRSLKIIMTFKLIVVMGFLLFLAFGYSTWDTWYEISTGFFRFGSVPVETPDQSAATQNFFVSLWTGNPMAAIDLSMIGFITSMAAIAGNGGLTNIPISNFTRDQGWGMGKEVGAIPSIIGGQSIKLSHVGKVFLLSKESLIRWTGWLRHVKREQMLVWLPACFMGMALPSMLSMQFLPRGVVPADKNVAAGMTAQGVADAVGPTLGPAFWYLTMFCGFLVLFTSAITTVDGVLRRWVDVGWTASPILRKWDTRHIGKLYFGALCVHAIVSLILLSLAQPQQLLVITTNIYNYALGISCLHVLFVNSLLLPKECRPGLGRRILLALASAFFLFIAAITTLHEFGFLKS